MPILKNLTHHKILLDTHVWLWALTGHSLLRNEFRTYFEKTLQTQGALISPLSIWEIGMLVQKKRIEIGMDVQDWINQALDFPGLEICDITPRIAILSSRLPREVHRDPVDCILIASAYEKNAVLVTCDAKILEFGEDKFISVFNPCR